MYFDKNFPTIEYDSVGNGEFKDVKNLLRRVALNTKVKTNALLYDTYDVKEGETPEMIAHKLYGECCVYKWQTSPVVAAAWPFETLLETLLPTLRLRERMPNTAQLDRFKVAHSSIQRENRADR